MDLAETSVEPSAMPAALRKNSRRVKERFRLSSRGEADFRRRWRSKGVGVLMEDELIP